MTRFGLGLALAIGVCLALVTVACIKLETRQPTPPSAPVASSAIGPTGAPTPDIRATVVAEITATVVASSAETPTPAPTATAVLPMPSGSFITTIRPTPRVTPTPTHAPVPINTPTLSSMVEDISPSVVQIITPDGNGSGFVIDADGLVLTNAHVVRGLSTAEVRFTGGRTYTGRILGVDEVADVALLDIRSFGPLEPVALGDSGEIMVGEDVVAMGFPLGDTLGASPTITRGIVSAKRSSESGITLLQTDAAINPGSSGGPLLGRDGQVVGVNTSKLFRSDDGRPLEGIGLAVSISDVRDRLDSLTRGESILLNTSPAFGKTELKTALEDLLPGSFEELDPSTEGISVADLGLEDLVGELVAYASPDPFQLILAATKELSELERIALEYELSDPDAFLNDVFTGAFMESMRSDGDVTVGDLESLDMGQIGDGSIGVWLDLVTEGGELRVEVAVLMRDRYLGMVYLFYLPTTEPSAYIKDIASAIDQAIVERAE